MGSAPTSSARLPRPWTWVFTLRVSWPHPTGSGQKSLGWEAAPPGQSLQPSRPPPPPAPERTRTHLRRTRIRSLYLENCSTTWVSALWISSSFSTEWEKKDGWRKERVWASARPDPPAAGTGHGCRGQQLAGCLTWMAALTRRQHPGTCSVRLPKALPPGRLQATSLRFNASSSAALPSSELAVKSRRDRGANEGMFSGVPWLAL